MFLMMSLGIAVPDQKLFPLQIERDCFNLEANGDALCNKDPREKKKKAIQNPNSFIEKRIIRPL